MVHTHTMKTFTEIRGATPEEDEALGYVENGVITDVKPYSDGDGWTITWDSGWSCGFKDYGVEPKIGDRFTSYGRIGRPFHGQAINGKLLWYTTVEQEEADRRASIAESEAKKLRKFADHLEERNAEYEGLPTAFKVRISRFRNAREDFRWDSEPYEMFCCTQAVILANWAMDGDVTPEEACGKIDQWNSINSKKNDPPYDYKDQMKEAPNGWSDGHSGNTHGASVAMAKAFIMGEDL